MNENHLYFVLISYVSAIVLFIAYFIHSRSKLKNIEKYLKKSDRWLDE
jgi:hypothetical protein|tara:strand:+ start:226 stop:369 length:144 start_codon:yes stop_codon:yes gene_type:complete